MILLLVTVQSVEMQLARRGFMSSQMSNVFRWHETTETFVSEPSHIDNAQQQQQQQQQEEGGAPYSNDRTSGQTGRGFKFSDFLLSVLFLTGLQ